LIFDDVYVHDVDGGGDDVFSFCVFLSSDDELELLLLLLEDDEDDEDEEDDDAEVPERSLIETGFGGGAGNGYGST
jgi:hypothetical protein